ncbi:MULTISPECIES: GNAT family N-acetyltransferase [Bacteroides]|uniref:GNAT family N-acetyltransferase n=1 Tax=Bacteroides TaxID=816 RepID=UPI00033C5028|nr:MULTISPECIES: GNAT family N-acetyltransferase [Bacteroides]UYU44967.1 GNAT family N-acetyltransferase [Bacteroides salyersiae]CCY52698.1 uncharacterized protein BN523_00069 [Bacteroides sp. CAG:189]
MIETKRLRIIPFDSEQFALLLNGVHFMENALRLTPSNETLDPHTRQAMTGQYQLAGKHPENFLLLTNWQIILKSENKAIGSACFKNLPDAEGSVEVGYGIYASYRNHGYMTEALKALCKWAFDIAGVQSVIAETEKDNIASQYVLQKSKMKQFKESADSIWWKLNKKTMEKKEIIVIRQETKQDRHELYHLIQTAFQTAKVADGDEQDFTVNLWNSENYIPELGLVAELNGKLIGHILLTRMYVIQEDRNKFESLLVAPLSVLLEYRDHGVGSALMKEGLRRGRELGYKAAFLCGDPEYYHRFGFKSIREFGLTNPEIPEPYAMGYELVPGALDQVTGVVKLT